MFILKTAFRNIMRSKLKSVFTVLICMGITMLLNVYWSNIESNRQQLADLAKAMPIYCRITNLNGSFEAGLKISGELIDKLQSSKYVKEPVFSVRLMTGEGEFHPDERKEALTLSVVGTNSIDGVEGIKEVYITMAEGMSHKILEGTERACIVSKRAMVENEWEVGDLVSVNLYYYHRLSKYELKLEPLALVDFQIVGVLDQTDYAGSNFQSPDILVPFEALRQVYESSDIPFTAESGYFFVANPLKLNQFKEEMNDFYLFSISPESEERYEGIGLFVKDITFINAASRLKQMNNTLMNFLPIIVGLVGFIGFIVSYLMVYSRKMDAAIMRSIGFKYKQVMLVFSIEQLILVAVGSGIQSIISLMVIGHSFWTLLLVNLWFLINFMLGVVVTVWMMGRSNVMVALADND